MDERKKIRTRLRSLTRDLAISKSSAFRWRSSMLAFQAGVKWSLSEEKDSWGERRGCIGMAILNFELYLDA